MALELYTTGTGVLAQPVVAKLYQAGVQVGADLPATATSAKHFVATIPVVGVARNLTDGYNIIWVDNNGVEVPGGTVLWDGINEIFRGALSVDESQGKFV